jgi:hypothetical protein
MICVRELAMLICSSEEAIETFIAHCDLAAMSWGWTGGRGGAAKSSSPPLVDESGYAAGDPQNEKFLAPAAVTLVVIRRHIGGCSLAGTAWAHGTTQARWVAKLKFSREVAMTRTVAILLTRKQRLLERLEEEPRLNRQDKIARLLARINVMLNRLDRVLLEARVMRR